MAGSRVGSLWKAKEGSKSVLNGYLDVCGMSVRISVFKNTDEKKNEKSPTYHIVSYGIDMPKPEQAQTTNATTDPDLPF